MTTTVKNIGWNFGGQALPMAVALFTIPILIRTLGIDRFGLLSIAWIMIGYLSLFDLGVGRAMTRQIAILRATGSVDRIRVVYWTGLSTSVVLGCLIATATMVGSGAMVSRVLKVPSALQDEAARSFIVLAVGLPVAMLSIGVVGALESFGEFRATGSIRFATGMATYLVPVSVAHWTNDMTMVVAGLVLTRAVITLIALSASPRMHQELSGPFRVSVNELRALLRVGGWMTVSNLVSPIMSSMDRFLLGAMISIGAITYYVTPADALTKALLVPVAVTGVLFPAFSGDFASGGSQVRRLYERGWDVIFLTLVSMVLVVAVFANTALAMWIGEEFASQSSSIAKWIAFGVLANGLAHLPYWMLQAAGRARAIAFIHLVEIPLYMVGLVILVDWLGVAGAAVAWTLRCAVDLVVLLIASSHYVPDLSPSRSSMLYAQLALLVLAGFLAAAPISTSMAVVPLIVGLGVVALLLWRTSELGWIPIPRRQSLDAARRKSGL